MKVIIGGPPKSGKSCLRYGLKEAIKNGPEPVYPYVITACPDGEGSWFHETMSDNPLLGSELKASQKGGFSDDLAEHYALWVSKCNEPLTIIDIGGRPDDFNKIVCKNATHAILIAADWEALIIWREFCSSLRLPVIAELKSSINATADILLSQKENECFRGSVHKLLRGDTTVAHRPTIVQLAAILAKMSQLSPANEYI